MPAEVMPPMYSMLLEEITWAINDKEPYTFTHYLILSKTYLEVESTLDREDQPSSSKKAKKEASKLETFYFHPEDEVFHRFATEYSNFSYTSQADEGRADSKRAFQEMGIQPQGHLILIQKDNFENAINAVAEFLKPQ
jgi:protein BCP1